MSNDLKVFKMLLWHRLKTAFPDPEDRKTILKTFQEVEKIMSKKGK